MDSHNISRRLLRSRILQKSNALSRRLRNSQRTKQSSHTTKSQKHQRQTNDVYKVVEAGKIEIYTATAEETGKKPVGAQSTEPENAPDSAEPHRTTSEQSRAAGKMKIEGLQGQSQDVQCGEERDVEATCEDESRDIEQG